MSTPRLLRAITGASLGICALAGGGLWATAGVAGSQTTTSMTTSTSPTTSTTTTSSAPTTSVPPSTSATVAATQLLAADISAANSARAVVWTATEPAGKEMLAEVVHAGRADGTETVTSLRGPQNVLFDVVLIGTEAYFMGNSAGLTVVLGFKASPAKKEADKWVSVPSSSTLYPELANGLTVSTATEVLDMVGLLTIVPEKTVRGESVVGVRSISTASGFSNTETAYIRADGVPLPVEVDLSGDGPPESVVFGSWGQPPTANAPKNAVSFDKIWLG